MEKAEWYVDWFNSPYYHLLYNNRDHKEAGFFIDNLCHHLHLEKGARLWDNACGKGRHAIILNEKGFDVTGTDLSTNSIKEAVQFENPFLHFFVHDMRDHFRDNYFDAVLNLFTSFGYFKNYNDNFKVFENVSRSLKSGGWFVFDFFNSKKVIASFKDEYHETRGKIEFDIRKRIENNAIIKRIEFHDNDRSFYFEESVSLFTRTDLEEFAEKAGLKEYEIFGDYHFHSFDEQTSDRLLLIFQKP
jgi:SAM-dependent methyltransferase